MRFIDILWEFKTSACEKTKIKYKKITARVGTIRKQLESSGFEPGTFGAIDYDRKKSKVTKKHERSSWGGEIFIRDNDQVILLKHPPRIGIIQNENFVVEVPFREYVNYSLRRKVTELNPDFEKVIEIVGPYGGHPARRIRQTTQTAAMP